MELSTLSDDELTERLHSLAADENRCLAAVLEHIAELDTRRLHERRGQTSCFAYCTRVLGYSEDAAYKRIAVARAARKYPSILSRIEKGELSLTAALILAPHLTSENHRRLLDQARGKSKFDVERIAAALAPRPDEPETVTVPVSLLCSLPLLESASPTVAATPETTVVQVSAEAPHTPAPPEPLHLRQSITPTAPERVRFSFSGSERLLKLMRRAQDVLRHKYPAGDLERIFGDALEALLDKRDPERRLSAKERLAAEGRERAPRPPSAWAFAARSIPQAVKDAVWRRDGGQCVHREPDGRRCLERGGLEYDHIVPFALGGPSNNPKNIRLLCKAHNLMAARRAFGEAALRHQQGTA